MLIKQQLKSYNRDTYYFYELTTFIHRVAFEEVSGHRVLINSGAGNRGLSERGTIHEATSRISSLDWCHPEVRHEDREPLPDKAGESTILSRSGGVKGLS